MREVCVPAPAKVNLFLHVTGRRADGYHLVESLMALVDLCDTLALASRDDGAVVRANDVPGVPPEDDLALRAARALKEAAGVRAGVSIAVTKRIPMGAGLGGGSSDAASVLLALNRLWDLRWPRPRLAELALTLGADVPFFVGGAHALARGIGEVLTAVTLPTRWLALVHPRVHVRTADVFAAPALTRDAPSAKIIVFSETYGRNVLADVVRARVPAVAAAMKALPEAARMTGSGSCMFAAFASRREAEEALRAVPPDCDGYLVRTLARHPLFGFAR
ncbi:MAG: 4-(cytidine 5'-diphospho)-2-C-methyl-D-erythritol kinase [Burkholderiales bacterium]|nr:4-(cytidine 5'-diphospho)-2-C-methyl-D-erythritol kinase [Burkholderiales bacterium]